MIVVYKCSYCVTILPEIGECLQHEVTNHPHERDAQIELDVWTTLECVLDCVDGNAPTTHVRPPRSLPIVHATSTGDLKPTTHLSTVPVVKVPTDADSPRLTSDSRTLHFLNAVEGVLNEAERASHEYKQMTVASKSVDVNPYVVSEITDEPYVNKRLQQQQEQLRLNKGRPIKQLKPPTPAPPAPKYPCTHCDRLFSSDIARRAHMAEHQPPRAQPPSLARSTTPEYLCRECNQKFSSEHYLHTHRQKWHPIAPPPPVQQRPSSAMKRRLFEEEVAAKRPRPGPKECMSNIQLVIAEKERQVAENQRRMQSLKPATPVATSIIKCDQCAAQFMRHEHLLKHRADMHPQRPAAAQQTTPHRCNQCEKRFATHHHLQEHMIVHAQQKVPIAAPKPPPPQPTKPAHKCTQCPAQYNDAEMLQRHRAKAHPLTMTPPQQAPRCKQQVSAKTTPSASATAPTSPTAPPATPPDPQTTSVAVVANNDEKTERADVKPRLPPGKPEDEKKYYCRFCCKFYLTSRARSAHEAQNHAKKVVKMAAAEMAAAEVAAVTS